MTLSTTPTTALTHHTRSPRSAVVLLFLIVLVLGFITQSVPMGGLALIASGLLVAAYLPLLAKSSTSERLAIVLVVLVLTIMLPSSVFRAPTALAHYFVVLLSLLSAFLLTRDIRTYLYASRCLLLGMLIAVFTFLSYSGLAGFPLENILPGSSSNGITSYLVVLQINYCIARYIEVKRASLVTPVLTLIICLEGWGRGSILASGGIIFVNMLFRFAPGIKLRSFVTFLLFVLIMTVVYQQYDDDIGSFFNVNTKIGGGLSDPAREQAIEEYLAKIDPLTFLIGADYRNTSIDTALDKNPHNSYIRAHHIFGLPYLVLMLLFPLLFLSRETSLGQKVFILSMLLILYFRAFTEPIIFPTLFDFFFFAACFLLRRPNDPLPV